MRPSVYAAVLANKNQPKTKNPTRSKFYTLTSGEYILQYLKPKKF
jgi:hypothetical protein